MSANVEPQPDQATSASGFDVERIRADFPALHQEVRGKPLVYLDNAATALKPQAVIDAVVESYSVNCANVHRGVHQLSQRATAAFEAARESVRGFINASSSREVVFVRGTTEGINLVANTLGRRLGPGDEVLLTELEHHSNIVPWQLICEQVGARVCVVPVRDNGEVSLEDFEEALTSRTRIVSVAHMSNALGTILPVERMAEAAHKRGIPIILDGAQAIAHMDIDVQALGCDFYAFSGHKLHAPTGVGVLWGREDRLSDLPPWQGGGEMIRSVSFDGTTYADIPHRFEAGTPDIAGVTGLGAAIRYLGSLDRTAILAHEEDLLAYATSELQAIAGLTILGTAPEKGSVISFTLEGIHPHDVGTVVDHHGVAIRTGHHCAQPLMKRFGVPATSRASFGLYNTRSEVDALVTAIHAARELLGPR